MERSFGYFPTIASITHIQLKTYSREVSTLDGVTTHDACIFLRFNRMFLLDSEILRVLPTVSLDFVFEGLTSVPTFLAMSNSPYSKAMDPSLQGPPVAMHQQMPPPTYSQLSTPIQPMYPQFNQAGQPATMVVQQPMMNQPMTHIYVQAPLGPKSQRMTCPSCQASIMTRVTYDAGSKTHLIALLLCLFVGCCGCCLIPYCKLELYLLMQTIQGLCVLFI